MNVLQRHQHVCVTPSGSMSHVDPKDGSDLLASVDVSTWAGTKVCWLGCFTEILGESELEFPSRPAELGCTLKNSISEYGFFPQLV